MRQIIAMAVVIVLSAADAFAGPPGPIEVTNIPTLSEWGMISAVAGLLLVGVFFALYRRRAAKV